MAVKTALKPGQRVEFSPRHNKAVKMPGTIEEVTEESVLVKADATNGNAAFIYDVHANDCTLIDTPAPGPDPAKEFEAVDAKAKADADAKAKADADAKAKADADAKAA